MPVDEFGLVDQQLPAMADIDVRIARVRVTGEECDG
jgi:hypothetical protein